MYGVSGRGSRRQQVVFWVNLEYGYGQDSNFEKVLSEQINHNHIDFTKETLH